MRDARLWDPGCAAVGCGMRGRGYLRSWRLSRRTRLWPGSSTPASSRSSSVMSLGRGAQAWGSPPPGRVHQPLGGTPALGGYVLRGRRSPHSGCWVPRQPPPTHPAGLRSPGGRQGPPVAAGTPPRAAPHGGLTRAGGLPRAACSHPGIAVTPWGERRPTGAGEVVGGPPHAVPWGGGATHLRNSRSSQPLRTSPSSYRSSPSARSHSPTPGTAPTPRPAWHSACAAAPAPSALRRPGPTPQRTPGMGPPCAVEGPRP